MVAAIPPPKLKIPVALNRAMGLEAANALATVPPAGPAIAVTAPATAPDGVGVGGRCASGGGADEAIGGVPDEGIVAGGELVAVGIVGEGDGGLPA